MEKDRGLRIHDQKQSTKLKQKNATHRKKKDSKDEDSEEEGSKKIQEYEQEVKEFSSKNKLVQNANQKIKTGNNGDREPVKTLLKKEKRIAQSQAAKQHQKLKQDISQAEGELAKTQNELNEAHYTKNKRAILEEQIEDIKEHLESLMMSSDSDSEDEFDEYQAKIQSKIERIEREIEQVQLTLANDYYKKGQKGSQYTAQINNLQLKIKELKLQAEKKGSHEEDEEKENIKTTSSQDTYVHRPEPEKWEYKFSSFKIPPLAEIIARS